MEALGSHEVRLALMVLHRGGDANHRLVDLCEARLAATGSARWEDQERTVVNARGRGSVMTLAGARALVQNRGTHGDSALVTSTDIFEVGTEVSAVGDERDLPRVLGLS